MRNESALYGSFLRELRSADLARSGDAELFWAFLRHYEILHRLPRRQRRRLERRWRRRLPAIALMLALTPVVPDAVAAMIEVTAQTPPAIAADGRCSLIEALENANADQRVHDDCLAGSGPDVVRLPLRSAQILEPDARLPAISSVIRLEGRNSTIRRRQLYLPELINVSAGGDLTIVRTVISGAPLQPADNPPANALLRNQGGRLALINSSVVDAPTGAGIVNDAGSLSMRWSTVSGNGRDSVFYGEGGIVNMNGGTATLLGSRVLENGSAFQGGGIRNREGSTITLVNSRVAHNRLTYEGLGGGIDNRGTLVLIGTSVENNLADFGGGLFNTGQATLIRSTVSGNTAYSTEDGHGGGIRNHGSLWIVNSTVSENHSQNGGGIASDGQMMVASSTITGNTARTRAGGLLVRAGTARLSHSIVSGNRVGDHLASREIEVIRYYDATLMADRYNVIGHSGDAGTAGFEPGPTDIVPAVSLRGILLPLANNGGPTRTHALAIDSPALDASPVDDDCPDVDQRRNRRPRRSRCDVGAFEGSAVLCAGEVTTIVGTPDDDFLRGTRGRDVIGGLSGDDRITGRQGEDVVCAGSGADEVWGGPGSDLLLGGDGDDTLHGNRDSDRLFGGAGDDHCDGGLHGVGGDLVSDCESIERVP